jgi:hypothetical protein
MGMGCGITLVVFGFLGSVSSFIGDKRTVGDNCTDGRISGLLPGARMFVLGHIIYP